MGQSPRIIEPDRIYHVTCRGNNRGPIAWDHHDYESLSQELAKAASRYRWSVFSWCFLTNHYHVLLRTTESSFSAGFRLMNGNHARRTNRRHGRQDHLFRHRPYAREVRSDAHLVAALLYVARNPLAAGLCELASGWAFGSFRAIADLEPAPPWLEVDEVRSWFGATPTAACDEFARLVQDRHLPVSNAEEEPPALSPE